MKKPLDKRVVAINDEIDFTIKMLQNLKEIVNNPKQFKDINIEETAFTNYKRASAGLTDVHTLLKKLYK
jgi:hypothetical protein